jgi:hypothetical protein
VGLSAHPGPAAGQAAGLFSLAGRPRWPATRSPGWHRDRKRVDSWFRSELGRAPRRWGESWNLDMVTLLDPSFELPSLPTLTAFTYLANPTGSPWVYTGSSGLIVTSADSLYPTPEEGVQAAYLDGGGSISQDLDFGPGGSFQLIGYSAGLGTTWQLEVGGSVVGGIAPDSRPFSPFSLGPFSAAGVLTLALVGISGQCYLDALDLVDLASPAPPPKPHDSSPAFARHPQAVVPHHRRPPIRLPRGWR